ncbi:DUF5615 family PIN-like protein [Candidatus Leptofilum sp.]|uniref:DUF5615 family PIN-like protein n=1 Tax=Candidatus Leptofilum sp. TaxID=3241576 RepID=UPI003B5BF55A
MSKRIRFHLDENVDPVIAKALLQYGIDVTTTVDAGLRTLSDHEHLEYATKDGRVVVTHDSDFLRMARQGDPHAGIAYCHKDSRSIGELIRALQLIYDVLTPDEMKNQVEYL